jgi:hypothetical protein
MHPVPQPGLGFARKLTALDNTALKIASKCSFTTRKLRFFVDFLPCLVFARRLFVESLEHAEFKLGLVTHHVTAPGRTEDNLGVYFADLRCTKYLIARIRCNNIAHTASRGG